MRSPETRTLPLRRGFPGPSATCALMMTTVPGFCGDDKVPSHANKIIATNAYLHLTNFPIVHTLLRSLDKLLRSRTHATGAQTIPHHDERDRDGNDKRRNGVDLGRDNAAEPTPDFEWQRIVAADEEESDRDFVHR